MDKLRERVRHVVATRSGNINWSRAMVLIDELNNKKDRRNAVFEAINEIANYGSRLEKYNCVSLVDALFKNGNNDLILALQNSSALQGLSCDAMVHDPYVHQALCRAANEWIETCERSRILTSHFADWRTRVTSFRYKYCMNQEVADKFSADFSTTLELLSVFNQAIATAFIDRTGADNEILQEILPNVHEVHERLKELDETMPDPYVREIIRYLMDYCELCKSSYSTFSQIGELDIEALEEMAARGIPQQQQGPPSPVRPAQQPAQTVDDLISLE
jgi:hypothetical protein